jgi:hypothetical protein
LRQLGGTSITSQNASIGVRYSPVLCQDFNSSYRRQA